MLEKWNRCSRKSTGMIVFRLNINVLKAKNIRCLIFRIHIRKEPGFIQAILVNVITSWIIMLHRILAWNKHSGFLAPYPGKNFVRPSMNFRSTPPPRIYSMMTQLTASSRYASTASTWLVCSYFLVIFWNLF